MQKNVAIHINTKNTTGCKILAGVLKRIGDGDSCMIRIANDAGDFRRHIASSSAAIADSSTPIDDMREIIATGKPTVLLNDWRFTKHYPNLVHVRTDDDEIGFKAANYLMAIGRFRSFGYVPTRDEKEWSVMRGRAFVQTLKRKGHDCQAFGKVGSTENDLIGWLKALPKPVAVFCAWDAVAADVAYAAKKAGVIVPSQLVILGVDNNEKYCTSASPHISSIEFDAENEGWTAAGLMLRMLSPRKGSGAEHTACCGKVKRIVERESTRPPAPTAILIERALKFIFENAAKGIGPQNVAIHLGVSRALLDLRFREMANTTVGKQILERRLDLLSAMLRKSKSPITRLTRECGFGSVNHAKAVFKKRFGIPMRDYRARNRAK